MQSTCTATELAGVLGISDRRVRELAGEGHVVRGQRGRYELGSSVRAYLEYRLTLAAGGDLAAARARKAGAEAGLKELELSRQRGDLVSRTEVLGMVRAPLLAVDASLRTARRRHSKAWARKLKTTQAVAMSLIDQVVEDVRSDLKAAVEEVADAL